MLQPKDRSRFPGFCLLIFVLLSLSCTTGHHGPDKTDKQAASLEALTPLWVVAIDGKKVSRVGLGRSRHYKVLAGTHTIEVAFSLIETHQVVGPDGQLQSVSRQKFSKQNERISFVAEAGHVYYIHSGEMNSLWRPFIDESREPVYRFREIH